MYIFSTLILGLFVIIIIIIIIIIITLREAFHI